MNAQSPNLTSPVAPVTSYPPLTHAGAVLTIDLDAIADNYRILRRQAAQGVLCAAVLKANAYGLGADRVAPTLAVAGCRHFFVAHMSEGIALRRHLPASSSIYVLHGAPIGAEADMVANRLTPVLNSLDQIEAWRTLARRVGAPLHAVIQVDTGMSRVGLSPAELDILAADSRRLEGINVRLVMSHLSWAEDPDHPANRQALDRFNAARARLPEAPACLANSSGVFLGPDYHFQMLRPGAALYGLTPQINRPNPMRPVIRLAAKVIQSRDIPDGTPVGYNGRWIAQGARTIATVGVGYADGFLRALGNKAMASVQGMRVPVVGAVSMDLITLDVSRVPGGVRPGDLVELIGGDGPSPDEVAEAAGTIGYEILTSLGNRYHRAYQGGASRDAIIKQTGVMS